ncbi:MAG: hypothetical protein D3903_14150 [Candidatus Electrothrix sp. GM3_4]|nr:hypothetical protein [Candidatus Electrothrix sp. GM3_4]
MNTLFHSNSLSNRIGRSLGLSSSLVSRTASDVGSKQKKENSVETDDSSFRLNFHMFLGLFVDIVLFYFILAVDAALTAKIFLHSLLGAKKNASVV